MIQIKNGKTLYETLEALILTVECVFYRDLILCTGWKFLMADAFTHVTMLIWDNVHPLVMS
jgi:hypothetical protein